MRVLVACEESGRVAAAFRARGHEAWSCDLLPTRGDPRWHVRGDVQKFLWPSQGWDLVIAHPPCTATCVSGNRTYAGTRERAEGIAFVRWFLELPRTHGIPRVAVEHPVSVIATAIRPADQYIHPWQFGHGETKKTGLWLHNLPRLEPTAVVAGRDARVWRMAPSATRSRDRSETYPGIAEAMAAQWGAL